MGDLEDALACGSTRRAPAARPPASYIRDLRIYRAAPAGSSSFPNLAMVPLSSRPPSPWIAPRSVHPSRPRDVVVLQGLVVVSVVGLALVGREVRERHCLPLLPGAGLVSTRSRFRRTTSVVRLGRPVANSSARRPVPSASGLVGAPWDDV